MFGGDGGDGGDGGGVCVCVCVVATRDTLTTITDEVFGDQSGHQGIQ